MSAIEPIEVNAEDLSEAVLRDIERVNRIDNEDAKRHKAEGNPDACPICHSARRSYERLAGNELTPLGEAIEKIARKLAEQAWQDAPGAKFTSEQLQEVWDFVLTASRRNEYRDRAEELIGVYFPLHELVGLGDYA
jgi:hypothetical protein